MIQIEFICPLEHGVHARPASEIEQRAQRFQSQIRIINPVKDKIGNAKSVLSLISADILFGDRCLVEIEGCDEQEAAECFSYFLGSELAQINDGASETTIPRIQCLPVSLAQANPVYLSGTIASPGLGQAKAIILDPIRLNELATQYPREDEETVQTLITQALHTLDETLNQELHAASCQGADILQAHLKIMHDPIFRSALAQQSGATNALDAIDKACQAICTPLRASQSSYLNERILDLEDISLRLASLCCGLDLLRTPSIEEDAIIISSELLTPSQLLSLPRAHIKGLVMGAGGNTSHTVILARSFGIPTLVGVDVLDKRIIAQTPLILDANNGILILESNPQIESYYRLEQYKAEQLKSRQDQFKSLAIQTPDGTALQVLANIASSDETQSAYAHGADGIGLFRTELLFSDRPSAPSEEDQFKHYLNVLAQSDGKKVVIRTLDIGGDKPCAYMGFPTEDNPFLGFRAIRMYPQYQAIIDNQFRALVRSSHFGEISIMIPMIANFNEIRWCKEQLTRIQSQLQAEGYPIGTVKLGVMAEVPSIAYLLQQAKGWIDFISIGSNDLTQYFFACDRGNSAVAHLYDHFNPAFLAFVEELIQRANNAGISVSLCGEMAAVPLAQPLLLGAGLRQFSMASSRIPASKQAFSRLDCARCTALFKEVLNLESGDAVKQRVREFLKQSTPVGILDPELVCLHANVTTKDEAIKQLTDQLELTERAPSGAQVEYAIWDREALFSTALGFSVAIPHCKSSHVTHNSVSVMTLQRPIDWGDDVEVDLIIMLTVTESQQDAHMQIFAKIARKLMHESFRSTLKAAETPLQMVTLLNQVIQP